MALKRTKYEVAFLRDGEVVELDDLEVWGVDELRAEREARSVGIKGVVSDGKKVTDLGDMKNLEAMQIWAALIRTGQYTGKSVQFRTEDYIGAEKVGGKDDPGEPVDPTQSEDSTTSD